MSEWAKITYRFKLNGWYSNRTIFRPVNAPVAQPINPSPFVIDIELVPSKHGMALEITEKFEKIKPPPRQSPPLQLD